MHKHGNEDLLDANVVFKIKLVSEIILFIWQYLTFELFKINNHNGLSNLQLKFSNFIL